jgi:hypothetical protein
LEVKKMKEEYKMDEAVSSALKSLLLEVGYRGAVVRGCWGPNYFLDELNESELFGVVGEEVKGVMSVERESLEELSCEETKQRYL